MKQWPDGKSNKEIHDNLRRKGVYKSCLELGLPDHYNSRFD